MKKSLLIIAFFATCASISFSQVDLSINPIEVVFGKLGLNAEFLIKEDIGIEPGLSFRFNKNDVAGVDYKNTGFGASVIGKYYFNPEDGCDKFNLGIYIDFSNNKFTADDGSSDGGYKRNKLGLGFYTGYKWVSNKNIIFELGLGLGRNFVNDVTLEDETLSLDDIPFLNINVLGRLSIGYRFNAN